VINTELRHRFECWVQDHCNVADRLPIRGKEITVNVDWKCYIVVMKHVPQEFIGVAM
jgi:hypothetical protein